jgi:hypothetical protein
LQVADRRGATGLLDNGRYDEELSEKAVTVKVRAPREHGRLVPEKTFLDIETGSLESFEALVRAEKPFWRETLEHRAAHIDPSGIAGETNELSEFFAAARASRHEDHVYYLRKRLHPVVAERLDELATLARTVKNPGLLGSIAAESERIAGDSRAWEFASLIVYQKQSRTAKEPLTAQVPMLKYLQMF